MFNENLNSVEKIVDMSNFWLMPTVEKSGFRHRIHESYNCYNELCRIDEETDLLSRKKTYWIEVHKRDGRFLSKTVLTLKSLYDFLQWHTA